MDEIKLIEPNIAYEKTFLDFINSFGCFENISWAWMYWIPFENTQKFITYIKEESLSINLNWKVPTTTFWLIKWDIMVWTINIRHYLNKRLMKAWWNIWYSIHPDYRKIWYWKEILRLWIIEARKLWIREILVTCDENNFWSRKVIENNGWILENILDWKRRYLIK